ncbi:alanine racemase [Tessaracoccus sp.]
MAGSCELTVDLDAINKNLALVAELSGNRTILVAVKANAYGHGLVAVARSIEAAGTAHWLGVATVSEAAALRAAGVSLPILKFSITMPDELAVALSTGLVFTVGDQGAIEQLAEAAAAAGRVAEAHLKIDTGMRRIGAEPGDAVALAQLILDSPHLVLGGIYTHLPVSDVSSGDAFTRQQFRALVDAVGDVEAIAGPVRLVHAANSGAVLGHDLSGTTMVRPGIMVYGSYPDPETPHSHVLEPVIRWTSSLTFVKRVRAGETVGYGRTWTAPHDTWVGTVSVGYGDGYSRLLSNRGRMLIDGHSHPIVGRVCMDQTMIDLGRDRPHALVGDQVVLVGRSGTEEITVEEIAGLMGTISYEVTCLISGRVARRHVGGVSPLSRS